MSGPAKSATKGLDHVRDALKKIDFGKFANNAGKNLLRVGGNAAKAGVSFARDFAPYAIAAVTAVETAFLGLAATTATYALKQIAEQENNDLALKTVLKDTKQLDAAMSSIHGLANLLGTSPDEIEKQLTKLISKGHDLNDSLKIVQGARDLKVLGNDVNALIDAFSTLDDKGQVTAKSIAALSGAGLDPKKLRAILGSAIGSSGDLVADIDAGIKKGTINSATLQAAALKTITEMTGKELGGLAIEQSKTLGGIVEQFKTLPDRLMDAFDTSKISGPLKEAMTGILAVISGPAGQQAIEALGGAFVEVADAVKEIATPENVQMLLGVMMRLGKIVFAITKEFGGAFFKSLVAIMKPLKDVMMLSDGNSYAIEGFMKGVKILGYIVGGVVASIIYGFAAIGFIVGFVVGAIGDAVSWVGDQFKEILDPASWSAMWDRMLAAFKAGWQTIADWFSSLGSAMYDTGASIVDGLWQGIKEAWASMIQSVMGLADLLPDAVKSVLGIASPAKAMMPIGKYTVQGITAGAKQEAPAMQSAFANIVKPLPALAGQLGGSSSTQNSIGDVNVTVQTPSGADAEYQGRAAGREVRREVLRMFDQFQPA